MQTISLGFTNLRFLFFQTKSKAYRIIETITRKCFLIWETIQSVWLKKISYFFVSKHVAFCDFSNLNNRKGSHVRVKFRCAIIT